jgi:2,4-dienoyl-CoA reductase-like NADH-dependent reductase (Old Yellow Enzyme family)/thioredoxin reductase
MPPTALTTDPLLTPIRIRDLPLKNRIVMPPMGTGLDVDGRMSDAAIAYYRRRASGGVAAVTVEALLVDPATRGAEPRIDDDTYIPGLRRLVDALMPCDVAIGAQLLHPGRQVLTGRRVGPSAIPINRSSPPPQELSEIDIATVVEQFAHAAARAGKAGFHFVEIHGAHGYLLSDFVSPLANRRLDRYGGSLEGRGRLGREVVRAVRRRLPDMPLVYRVSADEGLPGGTGIDEAVAFARMLEDEGVDCISVSAGHWRALHLTLAPMSTPRGHLVSLAAEVKRAVGVPVIAVGRLDDAAAARRVIADGDADLVAIGRGLIADPDWPRKVAEDRAADIRPCIACNACVDLVGAGGELRCAVNPEVGRDHGWRIEPIPTPRRVVVVGGGPAGMEAARVARIRGHNVSLWEREAALGGKLEAAASAPSKREVLRFRDHQVRQIRSLGVEIHTSQAFGEDVLRRVRPDVVIVATGADALTPSIRGIESPQVADAQAYLCGDRPLGTGDHIVVVGGSATGCETAEALVAAGARVTILEMGPTIGAGIEAIARRRLVAALQRGGVTIVTRARVIAIDADVVHYEHDGACHAVRADEVALAVGWLPRRDLLRDVLRDQTTIVVGDARRPADFVAAVNSGADAGLAV